MLYLLTVISGKILALVMETIFYRYLSLAFRLSMLQVFLGMVAEVMGRYIVVRYHQHNLWLFNYYWLLELWVMGITGILLLKNPALKRSYTILLLLPTAMWIYRIGKYGLDRHPSPTLTAISICLVIIYLTVLFQFSFNNQKIGPQPVFWLCLSVLLFFGGNVPFYSMFNYMYDNNPILLGKLFNITLVLNYIRYPMVAFSFYLCGRQHMESLKLRSHVH